ncbi:MAG: OmpA family protein [Polyangiaceae bacterium]
MHRSSGRPALFAATCALLGVACGGAKPPEAKVADVSVAAPAQSSAPSASVPTTSDVAISDEIRTKCGIPDADAYFKFDSANVTSKDHSPLDLVAKCFVSGPLKGRSVKLVGNADPRGESEYNVTLGQSRADGVGKYLDRHGMDKSKTTSSSRGAMDATGTDESSWQHDRRVDVLLAD